MATDKGYTSTEKLERLEAQFGTMSEVGGQKFAVDVADKSGVYVADSDIAEAGSSTTQVVAAGNIALKGDKIRFTTGNNDGFEYDVVDSDGTTITLGADLALTVDPGDEFDILRTVSPTFAKDGGLAVTSGPIQFVLDGSDVEVTEDTVTPSNNLPLPVKLTSVTGDINITAGDLNVQLSDQGANADVTRIGDGTNQLAMNGSGEATVNDADANTKLGSIDTKTPALGAAVIAGSSPVTIASDQTVPVSAVSLPLPAGASTEAKQDTGNTSLGNLDTKLPAQGAAVTAASTPVNIASDQTVPVSASSLPLPLGAATEAKQDTGNTSLATVAGWDTNAGAVGATTQRVHLSDESLAALEDITVETLDIVDLAYHSGGIPGTGANPVQLILSTSAAVKKVQVADTTGAYLQLMTGGIGVETAIAMIGPGSDQTVEVAIPASTRVSVKRLDDVATTTSGAFGINFLG